MEQFAEGLPRLSAIVGVAEALRHHLRRCSFEPLSTGVVHGEKAESLSQRDAIGTSLQEFHVRGDFPKHGLQIHAAHGSP